MALKNMITNFGGQVSWIDLSDRDSTPQDRLGMILRDFFFEGTPIDRDDLDAIDRRFSRIAEAKVIKMSEPVDREILNGIKIHKVHLGISVVIDYDGPERGRSAGRYMDMISAPRVWMSPSSAIKSGFIISADQHRVESEIEIDLRHGVSRIRTGELVKINTIHSYI